MEDKVISDEERSELSTLMTHLQSEVFSLGSLQLQLTYLLEDVRDLENKIKDKSKEVKKFDLDFGSAVGDLNKKYGGVVDPVTGKINTGNIDG